MRDCRKSYYLVLVLVAILLTGIMTSCGDGDQETATTTTTTTAAPTTTATQETTAPPTTTTPTQKPTTTVMTTTPPIQEEGKQITIIYAEDDDPVSGKDIWLSYYDENAKEWIAERKTTDGQGKVTFIVPEGEAGESFTFTFAFSAADVNEFAEDIKDHQRMGWRIPPDPQQTKLVLQVDEDFMVAVIEGSFQTWIPEF